MFALSIGNDARTRNSEWKEPENWKENIVETAGFVPLEVRFQKLQENGIRLQLKASEFDSVDMQKMYLDDDFRIEPGDELEEIEAKLSARSEFMRSLQEQRQHENKSDVVEPEVRKTKSSEPINVQKQNDLEEQ